MEEEIKNIDLRSEPMNEFLSKPPSWMLRNGLFFLFGLLVVVILLSHFIAYPDIVTGTGILITENPPLHIVTKASGKIVHLNYTNGSEVKANKLLAEIDNTAHFEDIEQLKATLYQIDSARLYSFQFDNDTSYQLGEVNTPYLDWKKAVLALQIFTRDKTNALKIRTLHTQILQNRELERLSKQQATWLSKELALANERIEAEQSLFKDGVTSKMDYYEKQKEYLGKQRQMTDAEKTIVQLQMTITDQEKQLEELKLSYSNDKTRLLQTISQTHSSLVAAVSNWKQTYLISSTMDGKIAYSKNWQVNMFVKAQDDLFTIIPNLQNYSVAATIPILNSGKVRVGQTVRIVNASFPEDRFGILKGTVKEMALTPDQDKYRVLITLPNGLTSTYKKLIPFKAESNVSVEIITDKMSLLERLFTQIRKLISRREI
jgi:multidrug efflux pump subunit AcrA (membrane-fusion protein)